MLVTLGLSLIILGFLSLHVFYWPTFVPRIGLWPAYYVKPLRLAFSVIGDLILLYLLLSEASAMALGLGLAGVALLSLAHLVNFDRVFIVPHNPPHVRATESTLPDDSLVTGLTLSGQTVAWPIAEMLLPRHLIEDRIGSTPLLISYCAACRSALMYDPVIDGQLLHFSVAGVWRRNMIIRDHETGTLWQQATGEALMGELKGKRLNLLGGAMSTWAGWKKQHAETLLATDPADEKRRPILPQKVLRRMLTVIPQKFYVTGFTSLRHDRIKPHDFVVGVQVGTFCRAYALKDLQAHPHLQETVAGHTIKIDYDAGQDSVKILVDGQSVTADRQWWLGWKEFHPNTTVYQPRV